MAERPLSAEIEALQDRLLHLGSLAEGAVHKAIGSLRERKTELAREVIEGDDEIDAVYEEIQEKSLLLLAVRNPAGTQLRRLAALLQIPTDLERIGDHAVDIAEITLRIVEHPEIKPLVDIPRMAGIVQRMVRESLDALVRGDTSLALAVCQTDEPVDILYEQLFDELIAFIRRDGDREQAGQAVQLLLVSRFLARIGDHATNIAERVLYTLTGRRRPDSKRGGGSAGPAADPAAQAEGGSEEAVGAPD